VNRFLIWYRALPRAMRVLLTINVVFYLLWAILLAHIDPVRGFLLEYATLRPAPLDFIFRPWTILSYNFVHMGLGLGGLIHIGFNMLLLYWLGRDHEEMYGSPHLLALYLLGGIGGGLLMILFTGLFPGSIFASNYVYGASASVFAVMTAVATFYPDKRIGLLLLGPVKVSWLIGGLLFLDLITLAGSNTAVAAHWGGVLAGFGFARAEQHGYDLSSWAGVLLGGTARRRAAPPKPPSDGGLFSRSTSWFSIGDPKDTGSSTSSSSRASRGSRRSKSATTSPASVASEAEVDRILDKISEEGYDALSAEEKQTLKQASKN
jgi:membrane associated rhomboid family serine protease